MSRARPGYPLFRLLALLLLWPLTAAAHGPAHPAAQDERRQAVKEAPPAMTAPGQPEAATADALRQEPRTPQPENVDPGEWVREKTGELVPLDTVFKNERGETVSLRQLVDRPTLLLPIYYRCPTGCSFEMANLAEAIRQSRHDLDSFRVISLSFDADETPEIAAETRPNYIQLLAKELPSDTWVFLTGDQDNIRQLTRAVGYAFKKKDDGTFIHASALIALDPEGRIIKYVYGSFIPGDVDLALAEAAKGTPATSIRRLLAFCFTSNPRQNQQILFTLKMVTAAVLLIGGISFLFFLRRKKTDQPHFKP